MEFHRVSHGALRALFARRSQFHLVGNHIDTHTGKWTLLDAGIGPNQDSFYEYLIKGIAPGAHSHSGARKSPSAAPDPRVRGLGYLLFGDEELLEMFEPLYRATLRHMKEGDWYMDVNMNTAQKSLPWFTALGAFWPGLQVLYGDLRAASRTMLNFLSIWRQYAARVWLQNATCHSAT
jgi:hypothetical protein